MPADHSIRAGSTGSSKNEDSFPENLLGTSPGNFSLRERTDSEGSDKVARFVLPSVDGSSPPKVLTLDEVTDVFKNIKDMELVHEIALNPEFKLQPYEPPEQSLERRIRDTMHIVFWDILKEQLQRDPPSYEHAIQLLGDIKECFPQILPRKNKNVLDHINEILDETIIRQQAEQGILDFKKYASLVIEIMGKCCAPVRDADIKKLTEIDGVAETFKGILETMQLMKLDMANYLLDYARNDIMAHSVEFEKKKFKEYLEYYKFGFPATENWLKNNIVFDANNKPNTPDGIIANAYMALMDWPENEEFPEILTTDKERILKLSHRARRLCVAASLISICSAVPIISQRNENRVELAKQLQILLQGVQSENDVSDIMENVWLQIKTAINGFLQKEGETVMDDTSENLLKTQIMQTADKNGPVRTLMWKRLQTYFRLTMRSGSGLPPPPPGYVDYQDELEIYATALKRVIGYNHSVFGDYFKQILTQIRPEVGTEASPSTAVSVASGSQ